MLSIQRNYSLSADQDNLHLWKLIRYSTLSGDPKTALVRFSNGHPLSGFQMVNIIDINALKKLQPFCKKKSFENCTIMSGFLMVCTKWLPFCHLIDTYDANHLKSGLFNYWTLKCPVFECFRNLNVQFSDPNCINFGIIFCYNRQSSLVNYYWYLVNAK